MDKCISKCHDLKHRCEHCPKNSIDGDKKLNTAMNVLCLIIVVCFNYDKFGWAAAMRGSVIFDKGKFMVSDKSGGRFFFEDNEMSYVEVIGNIYSNPELLKP